MATVLSMPVLHQVDRSDLNPLAEIRVGQREVSISFGKSLAEAPAALRLQLAGLDMGHIVRLDNGASVRHLA